MSLEYQSKLNQQLVLSKKNGLFFSDWLRKNGYSDQERNEYTIWDTSAYQYTGICISVKRLEEFLSGKTDLRTLFQNPERAGEYYDVVFFQDRYRKTLLPVNILPEEKLPAEGYHASVDERENVVVNIPTKDRSLLKELVYKLGWGCM